MWPVSVQGQGLHKTSWVPDPPPERPQVLRAGAQARSSLGPSAQVTTVGTEVDCAASTGRTGSLGEGSWVEVQLVLLGTLVSPPHCRARLCVTPTTGGGLALGSQGWCF